VGVYCTGTVEKILNFLTKNPAVRSNSHTIEMDSLLREVWQKKTNYNYEDHINESPWGIGLPYGRYTNSLTVAIEFRQGWRRNVGARGTGGWCNFV
jgi:hypothetical protein